MTPVTLAAFLSTMVLACGGREADFDAAPPPADAMPDAGPSPVDDIGLVPGAPLPAGDWLLVNEWALPDTVFALDPADLGGARREVMSVARSWSMGASDDGSLIAFSSADPDQTAHFGLTIGDAIQNSFHYAPATGAVELLGPAGATWTNVNDECHAPSADGVYVYICRRYDFVEEPSFSFKGWRLGRIRIADGAFEFLRADVANGPYELAPQPVGTTDRVLFEQVARPPATGRTLWMRALITGAEVMVRDNASRPVLGPDDHTILFLDTTDLYKLWQMDLDVPTAPAVPVSPTEDVGAAAWSPDGQTVVYTVYDAANACDHLERVTKTGATWSAPVRERDCTQTGEFIVDLAWVTIP